MEVRAGTGSIPIVSRYRVGVLASGTGSLLEAILAAADSYEVTSVVSDRPGVRALEIARDAGIPTALFRLKDFPDRDAFSLAIAREQLDHGLDLSASAGFMKVLSRPYFEAVGVPYVNSHPALLPAFPGAHAVRDALDYGVKVTGTSIILCDEGIDTGPVIAQEAVAVEPGDTEESLHERIKQAERRLFPDVIRLFAAGRVKVEGRRVHVL